MGTKVTIKPTGLPDGSSFTPNLNENLNTLADEFDSVIYRDGSQSFTGPLNMNNKRIYNLPTPAHENDPARLQDIYDYLSSLTGAEAFQFQRREFVATAGQTAFAFNYPALAGYVNVYLNGVRLATDDFSFSGSTVTLVTPASVNDIVAIEGFVQSATTPTDASIYFEPEGTGAVVRTLRSRLQDIVSVKNFGAKGDGSTVDTRAINLAIGSLTLGQTLYFPAGTYIVDNSDLQEGGAYSTKPIPNGANVLMDGGAWLKRRSDETNGVYFLTPTGNNILQVNIDGDEYIEANGMTGAWATAQCNGVMPTNGAENVILINSRFKQITYGVFTNYIQRWRVVNCDFYRTRLSSILIQGIGGETSHNIISNCIMEDCGDTAVAFVPASGQLLTDNKVIGCTAKNTQYRTGGYAFDVEGGHAFGYVMRNAFIGCTVQNSFASSYTQGGFVMGAYAQDSLISNCIARGFYNSTNDKGINIPGTRRLFVVDNLLEGFRGNGIYAEGADKPTIRNNKVFNCGDGSNASWSTILLSFTGNSTDALVEDNDLEWEDPYYFPGTAAAGILINRGDLAATVKNAIIRGNRLNNPIGKGIHARGFSGGYTLSRIVIEDNIVTGNGSTTNFQSNGIAAEYCIGLSLQDNRVYETRAGFALTGSTNIEMKNNTLENITTSPTLASWLDLTSTDITLVESNHFSTLVTTKIVKTGATNLKIRRNEGYKTEGHGTSVAITTGGIIAHGLDETPTYVSLETNGTTLVNKAATVDATNITVTHDGAAATAFFWEARA